MTKIETYLLVGGTAVSAALVCGLVAIGLPGTEVKPTTASIHISVPSQERASSVAAPSIVDESTLAPVVATNGLPDPSAAVSDEALLRLSGMVNIANSVNELPRKSQWQRALPVAEKLLDAPCDCGQRNWLSHFVEMGNYALSGSNDQYHKTAVLMVSLGRNNSQESAFPQRYEKAQVADADPARQAALLGAKHPEGESPVH